MTVDHRSTTTAYRKYLTRVRVTRKSLWIGQRVTAIPYRRYLTRVRVTRKSQWINEQDNCDSLSQVSYARGRVTRKSQIKRERAGSTGLSPVLLSDTPRHSDNQTSHIPSINPLDHLSISIHPSNDH